MDDDLYFYSYKSELNITSTELNMKIWEFYEIHPSRPRKLKEYGKWNSNGLVLAKETKWIRRRNLEVNIKYPIRMYNYFKILVIC